MMEPTSKPPLVSVIVPNYNHARYLPKRIDSILNQTFQDFELILLDDRSSDKSQQIIRGYAAKDERIKAYFNDINSGSPFKQWNKGVRLAQGTYIWLAESDDDAAPAFLEKLVPCLEENPKVGVAYCQSWITDEHDKVMGNMLDWTKELNADRWKSDYVNNGMDENKRYLSRKPTIPNASAVLFKKDTYMKTGMADEHFVMCGDWMHWIKMLQQADVCFVAEPLNYFRQHEATTRHILTHDKVLVKVREEYHILAYLLSHVISDPVIGRELKQYYFNRSVNFCPVSLKFSKKFLVFIKIVKKVDGYVYFRLILFILQRLITYGPEKLKEKLKRRYICI